MAYQFFAKAQAQNSRIASSPPLSSPPLPTAPSNRPPIHPPPLILPPAAPSSAPSIRPPALGDPNFRPTPYLEPKPPSYPTPHPHITIDPVHTAHIPSLSRITGLLLPIRYPSSFYSACITDPVIASLSRVAVYHDHPVTTAPEQSSVETTFAARARSGLAGGVGTDKVIGGIRCRLEKLPGLEDTNGERPSTNLYIQTLHLLSPHRGNGVAASLLNSLLFTSPPVASCKSSYCISPLVRHYNIRTVTAHVHETNEEALKWYVARGFYIEDDVVKGYYRRLNPGGAKIVRLDVRWKDEDEEGGKPLQPDTTVQGEHDDDKAGKQESIKEEPDMEDDDWEKVEADDDDAEHGVEHLADSRTFDSDDGYSTPTTRKRKADEVLRS